MSLRTDTQGALVEACQTFMDFHENETKVPYNTVLHRVQAALSLVERDRTDPEKSDKHRKLTAKARQVAEKLQEREWMTADELTEVTHRFGDTFYILRMNGYVIVRRKQPSGNEYKLVTGPGFPGWTADGKPRTKPVAMA